jgi:hypothetical protein
MIHMKLRQGGTYTPPTIAFTTVGNRIVHYRHDADIIQTGKIDYILSCIFTSLQRVDMFLKSYCYDQQQPRRMKLTRKHWDSSEREKDDRIEREQSRSLPVRYKRRG